jgi:rhamnose utilization protein RhaD (predicted bifunctional aldolase and dehydrogenase)/NAD(P)-dependent dehydrogenase (short-subunit alcohol dehydrogenase family)
MKNLWNSAEAAGFAGDLGQRVYSSRLIGRDPSLVLHGGGNTSVKTIERNVFGEEEAILHVKGSGWDLATIEAQGFSPCRMAHLLRLSGLESLPDVRMAEELRGCMTRPSAPSPSVEAILHAVLPARFVDHSHADALLSLCNTPDGDERVREAYGERVVVIPYVMPGFKLARSCARLLPKKMSPGVVGVILMGHGIISFGDTAEVSYGRMIELATLAEQALARRKAWVVGWPAAPVSPAPFRGELAAFRRDLSAMIGAPAILGARRDAQALGFIWRKDLAEVSQQGPATPDHVLRTKRLPMIGRDLASYKASYEAYFKACSAHASPKPVMLDPAPRVILDPTWGVVVAGRTAEEAATAGDLYRHTIDVIARASAAGGWRALPAQDIFDVEYWDLEQAKLRRGGRATDLTGEVAIVTGAASGIGFACAEALLAKGAAVVGLDVNPAVAGQHGRAGFRGIACDLTDESAVASALEEAVRAFGGVDILILNAGIFPGSKPIGELGSDTWRRVMGVNLDASFSMMRECHPLLKLAPRGGRVVVIGSKNVAAPGPGAAAYSASKAAVNQLARVAALEWGADGIRVNSIHPNMVFDTALWTPEVLESRARHYGMTLASYRSNNVLKVEVTSRDVAALAAELCGPLFAKTTGAQIPVDGGNERVI